MKRIEFLEQMREQDKKYRDNFSADGTAYYRLKFQRDIYKDLAQLEKAVSSNDEGESSLDMFSLEMFENIAYIMAKHADNNILDNPEDWLDEFSTFSIYQVLPELIKLWGLNVQTQVESKKNFNRANGK